MAAEGIPYAFRPTLQVDANSFLGEVSSRASGYLYGVAENGVPDNAVVESIDVSSISQKVIDGLQHPIGDVDHVAPVLDSCDYITVYMQDCFDTWYYCHDEIMKLRATGNYDSMEFVRERFLPQVEEATRKLIKTDYQDRLVYCLYNETDNAVWFGTPSEDSTWLMFDEAARLRFYKAWEETYDLVRSIDPDAMIGGPGYCDYNYDENREFLEYCIENDCMPDIMIYHELGEFSSYFWQDHIDEYREMEKDLGIDELPVIITEYGTMYECGAPADMIKYISAIEHSGAYANAAYWRLANNLNDTVADNNSPNSNWWLFRWYADMEGYLLDSKIIDIKHSDFENAIKYEYDRFHYKYFNGFASMTEGKDEITVICGGSDYNSFVSFKHLGKTNLGKKVNVKIETVCYEGLSGIVNEPTVVAEYTDRVVGGKLRVDLKDPDPTAVYHITLTPAEDGKEDFYNDNLPARYEFEYGTRQGGTYTYDSAYATTGDVRGMVGGLENDGDSVTVNFNVEKDDYYDLSVIFGNSNDGSKPADRVDTRVIMTIDDTTEDIYLPNTIKSEYTDKMTFVRYLTKGEHSLTLAHGDGTFVVDSLLVRRHKEIDSIALLKDSDRTNEDTKSFLAVAPYDGFYKMTTSVSADFKVDGAEAYTNGVCVVYLRKGLNYIDFESAEPVECTINVTDKQNFNIEISAENMTLTDGATFVDDHIENISCNGGSASFKINAPKSGSYRLTVSYSNNDEGGVHSYNVDLIERYITIDVNGTKQNLWCRNTYSWDTVKTATLNIELNEGENIITFTNDGTIKFKNRDSFAPYIFSVTVNELYNMEVK